MRIRVLMLLPLLLLAGCALEQEGYVEVNGGKVWYRVTGKATGVPLLLVHGGPGMTHYYMEPLAELGDERPVIFYDQLGCGKSDRPNDPSLWTIEHYVEELAQVRKALHLDRVHILGHSWGGSLALEYMLTKPKGVASLTLASPLVSTSRWESDQKAYLAALPPDLQETIRISEANGTTSSPEYQAAMTVYYQQHFCRTDPWPDYLNQAFAETGTNVYQYMWGPSEFTCTGTLKTFERIDNLSEIKVPVLLTGGRYDEATPESMALYQQKIPGSKLVIFENSGHTTFIDDKEANLKEVRTFLRDVDLHH